MMYRPYPAIPSRVEKRLALIRSVGEECVTDAELYNLVANHPDFILYDGFEPSGRMHIAQGVFKATNVNKCVQAGGVFVFWVADWFALMNDKMGGDLEKIQTVGKYFIEVWKAAGMDMSRVKFAWAADEITGHADRYWLQALDIARRSTVARVKKCCQIMGRKEDNLTAAQILYPIMQCTDIFFLNASVCQLGVDQRKVNMLAREYCDQAGIRNKPVILSHHMIYGLAQGQQKMSKSNPESAIFMEDTLEDVERKIRNAHCPRTVEGQTEQQIPEEESMHLLDDPLKNPCLDYLCHIIFAKPGVTFSAGGVTYTDFVSAKAAFLAGAMSEDSLKDGLIVEVNKLLQPVRDHFLNDPFARDLLEKVRLYKKEDHPTQPKQFRRLALPVVAKRVVVFAPAPESQPRLSSVFSTLQLLAKASELAGSDGQVTLFVSNWKWVAINCLNGSLDAINASNDLFVDALRSLSPSLMGRVTVVVESAAIMSDPGNYWISVINVGRAFKLNRVRSVDETNEMAGQVIAAMMHVANVMAADASYVVSLPESTAETVLAIEYAIMVKSMGIPNLPTVASVVTIGGLDLVLKPHIQGEAAKEDPDRELHLTDSAADVKRKMKRAFCEPQNIDLCPPLVLADQIISLKSSLLISRKPENGGDKNYTSFVDITTDFKTGALHPGDLKPAITAAVDALIESVRQGWASPSNAVALSLLTAATATKKK